MGNNLNEDTKRIRRTECALHSGHSEAINNLKSDVREVTSIKLPEVWKAIDGMKNMQIANLVSVILALIGIITVLVKG
jgi:hypothetical protein